MIGDQTPITAATEQLIVIQIVTCLRRLQLQALTSDTSMITIAPSLGENPASATTRFLEGTVLPDAIRSWQCYASNCTVGQDGHPLCGNPTIVSNSKGKAGGQWAGFGFLDCRFSCSKERQERHWNQGDHLPLESLDVTH